MNSKKSLCKLITDSDLDKTNKYADTSVLDECIEINMDLMKHVIQSESLSEYFDGYDLYGDGLIFITYE